MDRRRLESTASYLAILLLGALAVLSILAVADGLFAWDLLPPDSRRVGCPRPGGSWLPSRRLRAGELGPEPQHHRAATHRDHRDRHRRELARARRVNVPTVGTPTGCRSAFPGRPWPRSPAGWRSCSAAWRGSTAHGRRNQLQEFAATFCAAEVPERALADLEDLIASRPVDGITATSVGERFGAMHRTGQVQVFYVHDERTWLLTSWGYFSSGREADIPPEFGTLSEAWSPESCQSTRVSRQGSRLLVGRRVHTPAGRPLLLVLSIQREAPWFD